VTATPTRPRLLLAALLLVALPALSPSAETTPIPADHRWEVAIDVAGILKGKLGDAIREVAKQPMPAAGLAGFAAATNCDLLKDLDRVVISGVDAREDQVLCFAQGRFDAARLAQVVSAAAEHGVIQDGDHAIHHWLDDKKHVTEYGTVANGNLVIVGRSEQRMRAALDVLDGKAVGLGSPAWLGGPTDSGALLLLAAADGLDAWQGVQPNAESFKRLRSLRLTGVEQADALAWHASAVAVDAKSGQQIADLVRGLLAWAQMGDAKNQPGVAELIASAKIQQDGSALDITTSLPISLIVDALARQGLAPGKAGAGR
jgi:hypothetical protein